MGLVAMIQTALTFAVADGSKEFDGGEAGRWGRGRGRSRSRRLVGGGRGCARSRWAGRRLAHAADFAAAHGVGLSGEGEGTAAGLADFSGDEGEGDEGDIFVGADSGLIESHGPKGEEAAIAAEEVGGLGDVGGVEAGDFGGVGEGPGFAGVEEVGGAIGMVEEKIVVDLVGVDEVACEAEEERDIGAGSELKVEVGEVGGGGAARDR